MERFEEAMKKGIKPAGIIVDSFTSKDDYLTKKYNINYDMTGVKDAIENNLTERREYNLNLEQLDILDTPDSLKKFDKFIERMSDINLDEFENKHKQQNMS